MPDHRQLLLDLKTKLALGEITSDEFERLSQEAPSSVPQDEESDAFPSYATMDLPLPEVEATVPERDSSADNEFPPLAVIESDNAAEIRRPKENQPQSYGRVPLSGSRPVAKAKTKQLPVLWVVLAAGAFILGIIVLWPGGDRSTPVSPGPSQVRPSSSFIEPEMVRILGGTFMMGSDAASAFPDEKPVHEVTLSGFWLGKYEITQAEWESVMGSNPSYFKGDGRRPAENVSWNEAQKYIQALNAKAGKKYRLPTEAEWEFACRAGRPDDRYGDLDQIAWGTTNSGQRTHSVGEKLPNGYGLFDMLGNVWEWCEDWYGAYGPLPVQNPNGADYGSKRALRGGSSFSEEVYLRASNRGDVGSPDLAQKYIGFRLARD